jgi:hypothetical protein
MLSVLINKPSAVFCYQLDGAASMLSGSIAGQKFDAVQGFTYWTVYNFWNDLK